jgi:hypothetical protein
MTDRRGSPWSASQALSWIICQEPLKLENREWTSDMGSQIDEAQRKLTAAIGSGKVQAWGRREPDTLIEPIPRDPFCIQGKPVIVGAHGEMRELLPHRYQYDGPRWHFVEFDEDQIKAVFPAPPPPAVQEWMLNNAKKEKKQLGLVDDCMDATGCTKREALEAYRSLPDELRRKRGRPVRNSEQSPATTSARPATDAGGNQACAPGSASADNAVNGERGSDLRIPCSAFDGDRS